MTSQVPPHLADAFDSAKTDFLASLKDVSLYNRVSNVKSIDEVYLFTTQLQQEQSKRKGLRNLRKIKPYLDRLTEYAGVIEVFIQVKPDILALIWGPIKLLLQISDNFTKCFDAIVEAIAAIGNKLPLFEAYSNLFKTTNRVLDVLVLFYKDILDFYSIVFNLFAAKGWHVIFATVWPRYREKIDIITSSIERHSLLMTEEVSLANISEAHAARATDMDRWEKNFAFQERQDFDSAYSYISPKMYDDDHDRLQRKVCKRTGRWLEREQILEDWLDVSNTGTRLLWMEGIPGSGKTFIASMVVEKLRQSSNTVLFAFLNYKQKDVTPISVMHSLIFQLAIGDDQVNKLLKDLRAQISSAFRSNQRNLKSNTQFARETLINLLNCVGPVYIIVDGLDEVSKNEHVVDILNELLQVLKESNDSKLLISSRAQDEISRILKKESAKAIRIDERNKGCIHSYVLIRSEEWFSQTTFDQEDYEEIRGLLIPLSTKARSMFLYARVVMDNVQMCYTPEMVKDELRVLPENLDEAYARVLSRLNNLSPSTSTLCRRALGWIGCTPVPMTLGELSFALNIDPNGKKSLPQSKGLLNVVGLCGPIVEISDGYVNFVHFTVKEYLFDKRNEFLHPLESISEMTRTCLHYLSSSIFDVRVEPGIIEGYILAGFYRLSWFAMTQWIILLLEYDRLNGSFELPDPLLPALQTFSHERENPYFEGTINSNSLADQDFITLRSKDPVLHALLTQELHFRRMDVGKWKLIKTNQDDPWTDLDPFSISFASTLIHTTFEGRICQEDQHKADCHCANLTALYGERLFRCHYSACQPLQVAFTTRATRDAHVKNHTRSYKCPHPSCDFAELGFSTYSQLQKHESMCHLNASMKAIQSIKNPDQVEIVPLVSDLISMGMTAELKTLLPRLKVDFEIRGLLDESAFCGKLEIFQLLWKKFELDPGSQRSVQTISDLLIQFAYSAARGENVEVLEHLFLQTTVLFTSPSNHWMVPCVDSDSLQLFNVWVNQVENLNNELIFGDFLLRQLTEPAKQERFADLLEEKAVCSRLSKSQLGSALRRVALTACALPIARLLLKNGADVDYRASSNFWKTPLLAAAGKTTKDAAELMKLLLLAGADPNASYRLSKPNSQPKFVSGEIGARKISQWLPYNWDELVEWSAKECASKSKDGANQWQ